MSEIRLEAVNSAIEPQLRTLYESSFPAEERRKWESVTGADGNGHSPVLKAVCAADGTVCGMVSFWNFPDFTYIEHLAVDSRLRGKGIGAAILAAVGELCGKTIVLEVEPPAEDNPMALRRIGFYRRNGFDILECDGAAYPYIQPPYGPELPSVPLLLMATDTAIDPRGVERALHREVYGAD